MDEDVRVDEEDDVGGRLRDAAVAGRGRAGAGRVGDDDELVGRVVGRADRGEAAVERRRPVGRRDHHRERGGGHGQRWVSARISSRRSSTGSLNVTSSLTI